MAKKIQGTVIVLILCLCGYLVYQMYGEDVIYLIKNKMEPVKAAETEPQEESIETAQEKKEKLPGYFHAGKAGRAPVVKNQGEFGTCWAVASSSALESALLPGKHQIFSAELQRCHMNGPADIVDVTLSGKHRLGDAVAPHGPG